MPRASPASAPTLVGRGYSWSQSVQGRRRVADENWLQFEAVRDDKVIRAMVDDLDPRDHQQHHPPVERRDRHHRGRRRQRLAGRADRGPRSTPSDAPPWASTTRWASSG